MPGYIGRILRGSARVSANAYSRPQALGVTQNRTPKELAGSNLFCSRDPYRAHEQKRLDSLHQMNANQKSD